MIVASEPNIFFVYWERYKLQKMQADIFSYKRCCFLGLLAVNRACVFVRRPRLAHFFKKGEGKMDEREIIVERLGELEMRIVKNFAKLLRIENIETLDPDTLIAEIADVLLDDNSKVYGRTRTEIKRILLKYGKRIRESDGNFEKELVKLKDKFKREQRIILKAYEIELNEFFSDPANFSVY